MNNSANIIEMFSSIQGEGLYMGCKQIFVRLTGCNLACEYCDTNCEPREYCRLHTDGFVEIKNPVSSTDFINIIKELNKNPHHSLSITGGEPLLNEKFLKSTLPLIRETFPELKIYLETNGTLPVELKKVAAYVDIVAMDIKLESSTGQPMTFNEHAEFIKILEEFNKEFFVKVIFGENFSMPKEKWFSDLRKSKLVEGSILFENGTTNSQQTCYKSEVEMVKKLVGRDTTVILQPITEQKVSQETLFALQDEFLKDIKDVRVIPQVHKFLGLR